MSEPIRSCERANALLTPRARARGRGRTLSRAAACSALYLGGPLRAVYFGMFQSFSMILVSMASPWHVEHSMSSLLARAILPWYSFSMNS